MPECSYCFGAAATRTFEVKAECAGCQRALCDNCTHHPLCAFCHSDVLAHAFAHAVRLRATCVLLEGEAHGALDGLLGGITEAVLRDYARWKKRRPGQPMAEWLRLCAARLASMDRAPADLPHNTAAVLNWVLAAPPMTADNLVHPQKPEPALLSDSGRRVLWVPTLIDGRCLADPRLCGGCLYHARTKSVAIARIDRDEADPPVDRATRRARVEQAVAAVRYSDDAAEERAAIHEKKRVDELLLRAGLGMDL